MEGEPTAAVADSASEAQAAPSVAAGPSDVTHGDQAEQADQTDPAAESEALPSGDDEDDDPETTPSDSDTEEEAKSKAQKRRERRQQREAERIEREVSERLAAREREQAEAAETAKREADIQKAREAAAKEFAEYIGEPGESDRLTAEIDDLNRQVRAEIADPKGVDLESDEGLLAQIAQKEARRAEIVRAQGFQNKIAANIWNGIEAHMLRPLSWPEFADQAARARFNGAEGGIAGAWDVAREVIREAIKAEHAAEIEALRKGHADEKATLEAVARDWRIRAGGAEVPDTTSGGAAVTSGDGVLTPERYSHLTSEERAKLRSTPEGRAQIDRMVRTGAA